MIAAVDPIFHLPFADIPIGIEKSKLAIYAANYSCDVHQPFPRLGGKRVDNPARDAEKRYGTGSRVIIPLD